MPTFALDLSTHSFSRPNALYLANAAALAYEDDPAAAARETLGLATAATFAHRASDTQGFVGRTDDFAVLAFRGSERPDQHPKDWLTNFQAAQVRHADPAGNVHAGFFGALGNAWSDTEGVLRTALTAAAATDADQPGLPLFVTGHSLGGALATLAACRLATGTLPAAGDAAAVRFNLRAVYTFGAPRVGDAAFCAAYKIPTFRLVNDLDIVPLVPFQNDELGRLRGRLPSRAPDWIKQLVQQAPATSSYGDVPTLVYLDNNGRSTVGGARPDWLTLFVTQALRSLGSSVTAPVGDHLIGSYIKALV